MEAKRVDKMCYRGRRIDSYEIATIKQCVSFQKTQGKDWAQVHQSFWLSFYATYL